MSVKDCQDIATVYSKKYAHGFVVLCFVVVMQSFITNSHEVFIHIHQGYFAGTGAIVRLPQCQWSKPDGYGKISQCITTTKHSKAKTVCIFLGIYCTWRVSVRVSTACKWLIPHLCKTTGAYHTPIKSRWQRLFKKGHTNSAQRCECGMWTIEHLTVINDFLTKGFQLKLLPEEHTDWHPW